MAKTRLFRLGDLQLRIMKVLWSQGEATVAEVHRAVGAERDLAYTTVATMLRKMEARGLVRHRLEARSFVYGPARCTWPWAPAACPSGSGPSLLSRPSPSSWCWPMCPARSRRSRGSPSTC